MLSTNAHNAPSLETIANLCLDKFKSLPKTGKPTSNEWTVLAGIVQHDAATGVSGNKVVALAAGTKCIGPSKFCPKGYILNDSHAEVLARRALLRYFYHELEKAVAAPDDTTIFEWQEKNCCFQLKSNISFHFLSTQTPCGDACILSDQPPPPPAAETQSLEIAPPLKKRRCVENVNKFVAPQDIGSPLCSSATNVYTGAKLLGQLHTDVLAQNVGAIRTKPGRGERTLSISCSDKLSKWNIMGLQGALLHALLERPIFFETMNFCDVTSDANAMKRALYERWQYNEQFDKEFVAQRPEIRVCDYLEFEYQQTSDKQPTPNGLVWCHIPEHLKSYEVSVNGKRQGITAKHLATSKAALYVSKYFLLRNFIDLLKMKNELLRKFNLEATQLEQLTYMECKQLAKRYQQTWLQVKCKYFQQWTEKPKELLNFTIK